MILLSVRTINWIYRVEGWTSSRVPAGKAERAEGKLMDRRAVVDRTGLTDWLTDWLTDSDFFSMYPKSSKKVCCIKGSCITRAECWPGYRVQCVSSMGHSDVAGKHFKQGTFTRGSNNNQVLEFRSIFAKLFAELLPGFSRSRIH